MTEFNKCTCVKVNKEKMDLIKAKGLKLQDILDNALNEELKLEKIPKNQQKITELKKQVKKLEKTRNESIADCEKKIDILMKNLIESKNREEEEYNKKIHYLNLEIDYLEKELKNKGK
ncbi:MAG: hypothetical protein Q4Q23_04855 [Methanobacteriaceae archaeon]|nr:hypothetical protein [Methanobacteriaceae archaeon]